MRNEDREIMHLHKNHNSQNYKPLIQNSITLTAGASLLYLSTKITDDSNAKFWLGVSGRLLTFSSTLGFLLMR